MPVVLALLAAAAILSAPLYVNMKDAEPYRLGLYDDGKLTTVATSACGLWSPSAVRVRARVFIYATEYECSTSGGWTRIVRFTSRRGVLTDRRVIGRRYTRQIRMPTVAYHRGRFHLWYTQDRRGRLARAMMYASSRDGLHFGAPRRVFGAGSLTAISVSTVFRRPHRRAWYMLIEGYSPDLTRAWPYLLTFRSPRGRYVLRSRMRTDRPTSKIDASLVCRDGDGWQGLFTAYGDGRERTMHYASRRLTGPWRLLSGPENPALPLPAGFYSLENPTRIAGSAMRARC